MPLFLIEKDASTKIPKECSLEEARGFLAQGFGVQRIGEGGELLPLEDDEPVEDSAEVTDAPAPAPARKTATTNKKK
jgi:hypothetical protein